MIDSARKDAILESISGMERVVATGGSTSNTIHGLARLGCEAGYIGNIGNDEMGEIFRHGCVSHGVVPHLIESDIDTGVAITFITPDAERTFATYLGAASTMQPGQIDYSIFDNYDIVHVEGYLIFNHDLILDLCKNAKQKGLIVSMDMASYNLIEENHSFVDMLLKDYVDIIFSNEEEAKAFTGKDSEEALKELSKYCKISVVKIGKDGSLICTGDSVYKIDPVDAVRVDTTGAGDIYAAGFLYGLSCGFPLERSGNIASYLSSRLIEHVGAKLPEEVWLSDDVKRMVR